MNSSFETLPTDALPSVVEKATWGIIASRFLIGAFVAIASSSRKRLRRMAVVFRSIQSLQCEPLPSSSRTRHTEPQPPSAIRSTTSYVATIDLKTRFFALIA
jgi:hypothetical protein